MKADDLKPSYENLLNTLLEDTIDRRSDVFRFVEVLDTIDDSFSIALDGDWGSGKTFFVKQSKMVIEAHNNYIKTDCIENKEKISSLYTDFCRDNASKLKPQVCVYYDAWQNDNDDDPILSLVYTILNSVDSDYNFKKSSFLKCAASIMEFFTGKDWNKIIDNLKGDDPLESIKSNKSIETLIKDFFNELLPEKGERLIIFIDELDRCKPTYAVHLLERIKHYFENERITFVFSVNLNELQHTIRKYYGSDFNASKYLDRFFDLRIGLPTPNLQKFYCSINFGDYYVYEKVCRAVIKKYNFELRTISKYLKLCRYAYNPNHKREFDFPEEKAINFILLYFVPIALGLKISDLKRYEEFIHGKNYMPLVEIAGEINLYLFDYMLFENETYNTEEIGKDVVTIESKLEEVYNTIFITTYDIGNRHKVIGGMNFNLNCKKEFLRVVDLMSKYTDFDAEQGGKLNGQA